LANRQAGELAAELSAERVFAATGTRLTAKAPLAVWRWLAESDPERWRALRHWAGVADLAALALTGEFYTDHTLAGRTAAYRLPGSGEGAASAFPAGFDAELLAAVELPADRLPQVSHPGQRILGKTLPKWGPLGIPAGVPVLVAGHDHAVGAWAAGVRKAGQSADSLGTAEAIYTVVAARTGIDLVELRAQGMSLVGTLDGDFALLAGHSAAGAMVSWWLEHHAGELDVAGLGALAASVQPDPELIVLPYPFGRNAPAPDPNAQVRLLGRQPWHSAAEEAAAVFNGLALHAAWMLEVQSELGGVQPEVTLLGGPGSTNPAWLDAKLRHMPGLRYAVESTEPVACGAALFALAATGQASSVLPRREWAAAEPASGRHEALCRARTPYGDIADPFDSTLAKDVSIPEHESDFGALLSISHDGLQLRDARSSKPRSQRNADSDQLENPTRCSGPAVLQPDALQGHGEHETLLHKRSPEKQGMLAAFIQAATSPEPKEDS
jgi:sugar (pentulose or hexulose) kinase